MLHKKGLLHAGSLLALAMLLCLAGTVFAEDPTPTPLPALAPAPLASIGSPKILVVLVEFKDEGAESTMEQKEINYAFFGDSTKSTYSYPYENVVNYYSRSSYGALRLQGTVTDWFTPEKGKAEYLSDPSGAGLKALVREVLDNLTGAAEPLDLAPFDNDGDGILDHVMFIYSGDYEGDFYSDLFDSDNYTVGGVQIRNVSFVPEQDPWSGLSMTQCAIHNIGHALGLPDYYYIGDYDMMSWSYRGDHNCFSKLLLGWVYPTVYNDSADGVLTVHLGASAWWTDCVMIMPDLDPDYPFSEFYMVQYRNSGLYFASGNDQDLPYTGLLIWHVSAEIDNTTMYFANDWWTNPPLLRLVQADGVDTLEYGDMLSGKHYYCPGDSFGPSTYPPSTSYSGKASGVIVDNITWVDTYEMRADFNIDNFSGVDKYSLTVYVQGSHLTGTVTPLTALFNLNDNATIVATPNKGYRVKSWQGTDNDSLTTNTNHVVMNTSKKVYVEFTPATDLFYTASVVGGHGKVWPVSLKYLAGSVIVVSAEPDAGYRIKAWSGTDDDSLKTKTNTVTMDGNKNVTVEFELIPDLSFSLSTSVVGGNGTLSKADGVYDAGMQVMLTAVPQTGYVVKKWTGVDNITTTSMTAVVTISRDTVVTVEFAPVSTDIDSEDDNTSTSSGGDTGSGSEDDTDNTAEIVVYPDETQTDNDTNSPANETDNNSDDILIQAEADNTSGDQPKSVTGCAQSGIGLIVLTLFGFLALVKVKE